MNPLKKPPDFKNAQRIGIMGGSFDPIHYGHLSAAEGARHALDLDFVLLIPTGQPPHKTSTTFSEHRYLMTTLAAADNPYFYVSRMELDKQGPSYTIDTLKILKNETDAELFFIVGADEMMRIMSWKDAVSLLGICHWIAATRPGYDTSNLSIHIDSLAHTHGMRGQILKIPGIDISATELRSRVINDIPIKYFIPPAVEKYIQDFGLYKHPDPKDKVIWQAVADKLSKKRYRHTLGVLETALLLAARHGINLHETYLAALLHDYAKELTEAEKRALCKEFNIPLDPIQTQYINLMHGQLSAELARRQFNIEDTEVLEAISYHTTGRTGMGILEKIIKIADNIEPNRPNYPGIETIKSLANTHLNQATAASIKRDIQYTKEKGHTVHPWGQLALEYLNTQFDYTTPKED